MTDVAGNPLGDDFAAAFTTSAAEVSPHGTYSEASNLCRNCHLVRGSNGPKGFTAARENAVCYICHDGTGATLGGTGEFSYHGLAPSSSSLTHVSGLCSDCHDVHGVAGAERPSPIVPERASGSPGS